MKRFWASKNLRNSGALEMIVLFFASDWGIPIHGNSTVTFMIAIASWGAFLRWTDRFMQTDPLFLEAPGFKLTCIASTLTEPFTDGTE
jgi:hypothetical protein